MRRVAAKLDSTMSDYGNGIGGGCQDDKTLGIERL